MPYVEKTRRADVIINGANNAGELNYEITSILVRYYLKHGNKYQVFNDIIGALEGAKLEFYRRVVAPYEDLKREKNGDVYE